MTAILHTWGQTLSQHIHLHCVVTGGALAPGGSRWLRARAGFLFPVRALSKVFRGTSLAALRRAFEAGELHLTGSLALLADPAAFTDWLAGLRHEAWVVYCKPPFAGPAQVLASLARYTHRVAIANERLVALEAGRVRFRWRDYADGDRVKVMELDANEFIRRFLLHIVPHRFMRIRYFGLVANRGRAAKLARCRAVLAHPASPPPASAESVRALMLRVTGIDIERCPVCQQGRLRRVESLPPERCPRVPAWDTS